MAWATLHASQKLRTTQRRWLTQTLAGKVKALALIADDVDTCDLLLEGTQSYHFIQVPDRLNIRALLDLGRHAVTRNDGFLDPEDLKRIVSSHYKATLYHKVAVPRKPPSPATRLRQAEEVNTTHWMFRPLDELRAHARVMRVVSMVVDGGFLVTTFDTSATPITRRQA